MQLQKASTACRRRGECGQSTVEFAVVAAAFLAVTLGLGALWRGVSGRFVHRTCAFNGIAPHRRRGASNISGHLAVLSAKCERGCVVRAKTWRDDGQATVESAFLIPVLFTALLLLVQPGMVLYDRMVMAAAATDACRVLAVKNRCGRRLFPGHRGIRTSPAWRGSPGCVLPRSRRRVLVAHTA